MIMARKRDRKKKSKYLGHRTFGTGNVKNERGNGNRGGCGKAGRCKHKMSWVTANLPNGYYGKIGFHSVTRTDVPVVNLYEINRMAVLGKLEKKGDGYNFQFDGKVLATGQVTKKLSLKAKCWSKKVEEKLKAVGGEISKYE